MSEEQAWIVIGLIVYGLFKPRLAMHWYYARKHLFWRPIGQKIQARRKRSAK